MIAITKRELFTAREKFFIVRYEHSVAGMSCLALRHEWQDHGLQSCCIGTEEGRRHALRSPVAHHLPLPAKAAI